MDFYPITPERALAFTFHDWTIQSTLWFQCSYF